MATLDYELILMLDPQAGDDAREKVAADAKSKLEAKGEIKHEANWGMRKMAYEIDRRGEADYRFCRFTGGKDLLDDLDHSLKITDGVLRFRIFKVDADSPNITPPDTEQIMRRDEDDRGRGRGSRPRRSRPAQRTRRVAPPPIGSAADAALRASRPPSPLRSLLRRPPTNPPERSAGQTPQLAATPPAAPAGGASTDCRGAYTRREISN